MSAIFLPIKPQHSGKIALGVKSIEFRKVAFRQGVEKVVVYSSYPTKKAIGIATVSSIRKIPVSELMSPSGEGFRRRGCVALDGLKDYYKDTRDAVLLEISKYEKFKKPIAINKIAFKIPQSFRYLTHAEYKVFSDQL